MVIDLEKEGRRAKRQARQAAKSANLNICLKSASREELVQCLEDIEKVSMDYYLNGVPYVQADEELGMFQREVLSKLNELERADDDESRKDDGWSLGW